MAAPEGGGAPGMIDYLDCDGEVLHNPSGGSICNLDEIPAGLFGAPPPRVNTQPRPDADGVIDLSKYYEEREVSLKGWIRTASWSSFFLKKDAVMGALALDGQDRILTFTQSDGTTKTIGGRIRSEVAISNEDSTSPFCSWQASFGCSDPRLYGTTLRQVVYNPLSGGSGGISIPLVFPLDLDPAAANIATINNGGNWASPPILTFQGPWTNPWVANLTTGVYLYTTGLSLGSGETIAIDTSRGEIIYGGTSRLDLIDWSRSSWPVLARGSNSFQAGGSFSTGALLTVSAYDVWIG